MWDPMQSLMGLMSRKQQTLYEQFKEKCTKNNVKPADMMERMISDYLDGGNVPVLGNKSGPAQPAAPAYTQLQPSPLLAELERYKAVRQCVHDISEMEEGPAQGPAPEDTMIQTLLTTYLKNQQGGAADLPRP